jgi:hypothetical protein
MKDPWEKAYVYGRAESAIDIRGVAHILEWGPNWFQPSLCGVDIARLSHAPKPYPVCQNCLGTKRAEELGL